MFCAAYLVYHTKNWIINVCSNEVVVTKVGGGTLVCCNKDMERIS